MRLISIFMLVLLLVGFGSIAAAQEPTTYCGELSEEDCALLTDASANMLTVDSAVFTLDATFSVETDVEDLSGEVTIEANGSFSGASHFMAMGMMDPATMTDPAASMEMMTDALAGFNGELNLVVTVPEAMVEEAGTSNTVDLQLRVVDGIGYINFDALSESTGEPIEFEGEELTGWGGVDLIELITRSVEEGMDNMDMDEQMEQMENMPEIDYAAFEAFILEYVTVERSDDTEVNGVTGATFVTSIDLTGLLSDEAFQAAVAEQIVAMSGEDADMSEEELMQNFQSLSQIFDGAEISTTVVVDAENNFIISQNFNFTWDVNPFLFSMAAGQLGGESGASSSDMPNEILLTVDVTTSFDRVNNAPAVTAPDGANIIEVDTLLEAGGE